jgi:prefoldin subunit 5
MSALFVAVTFVCALGASAMLTTAGRGGLDLEEWNSAISNLLVSIGLGTSATTQPDEASVAAIERDIGATNVNVDFLTTVVHDTATATNQELARVYNEITSLKSEVSTLRAQTDSAAKAVSARVDDLAGTLVTARQEVGTLRANVGLLQTSMDDISVMHDQAADAINKRLAKIEDVISIRADVTASIPRQSFPPLPQPRKRAAIWTAAETSTGLYLVKGPTGTYEVAIGSYVPGLGRIEAVRHQDGRLILVTGKDRAVAGPAR